MNNSPSSFPIHFADIAANPHILALQRGFSPFLSGAHWWILDDKMLRRPFPFTESTPYCSIAVSDANIQKQTHGSVRAFDFSIKMLRKPFISWIVATDSCRVSSNSATAKLWLEEIGVCKVESSKRELLEQVLRIIDGYLILLANTLENNDDFELVHHVLSDTISVLNLNQLLERLTDEFCSTLGISRGLILLINEDGEFYPAYVRDFPKEILKLRNLHLTRYEYQDLYKKDAPLYFILDADDPLRQWFMDSLQRFRFAVNRDGVNCMGIPFLRNNYVIGILLTVTAQAEFPTGARERLIQLLSAGGATALDNALILERMNQRRKALSTIHVVHRLVSANISTKEMVAKIGQLTRQLLKVKKCSIMLMDGENELLIPHVTIGLEKNEVGQLPLQMGEGLPGWVAENLNPVIYHPDEHSKQPWDHAGETYPADSYMSVALFDEDVEGVITVADTDREFTPGDREILLTFSEQALLAIKSARLHEGERTITINVLKSIAEI